MISFIWAESVNKVIGKDNKLPWSIKEEMQHFVEYTRGKTVLMGRNTWEGLSLKPLPKRKNIVITSKPLEFSHENLIVSSNLQEFLDEYKNSTEELVIIGGTQIFNSAIKFANKLVVSCIKKEYNGDIYAPKFNLDEFKMTYNKEYEEFSVKIYEKEK